MRVAIWRQQDAMRPRKIRSGVIPRSFRDRRNRFPAALQPRALTAIFGTGPMSRNHQMPYALTSDNVGLYFEEAGQGTPVIFLHEFAADHSNWEPQMRYFSRGHRCIAYSARGYTPSDVPPTADVYTYKHFYTDALAVLDHLKIAKAHFVGLSMGSYSSLQISLHAPERALSMTLAAVGSGSDLDQLEAFRKQCQANGDQFDTLGAAEVAKVTREAPSRIPF